MIHHQSRLLDKILKNIDRTTSKDIEINDNSFIINQSSDYYYKPVPTGELFHNDKNFVRLLMGPYGSGKTSALLSEIILKSVQMPKLSDGIRYSKWVIIRNTSAELETTTFQSWLRWFGELGQTHQVKKPVLQFSNRFNDGNGIIDLKLIFLALDREEDIKKLKSLEVTAAYINEASEIPFAVLNHLKGRVKRFPPTDRCSEPYWNGIIMDSNPPNAKHWIFNVFEKERYEHHVIYKQPPGLIKDKNDNWVSNPKAENLERLGTSYYTNMANGSTEEFIKVYCLGEYGTVITGKKVYREYNDDMHSKAKLWFSEDCDIHIGMDFGTTPCAVFVQEWPNGQTAVIAEITSEFMGIRQFIEQKLTPFVSKYLNNHRIGMIVGDPAGAGRSQTEYTSCFDILHEEGYAIEAAPSNLLTPRLEAVRYYLSRLIDGQPLFVINRDCEYIREGFLGGYQYKKLNLKSEQYKDEPEKNKYSHPHDALQYVLLALYNSYHESANGIMDNFYPQETLRF